MFTFKYKDYSFNCDIGTMTPNLYIKMIILLETYKPKRICELGSGLSTNIFNIYKDKFQAQVFSIENDEHYNNGNCIMLPLTEHSLLGHYNNCIKYNGFELWLLSLDKFDFVLIDGPNDAIPFSNQNLEFARIQLFDFVLFNKLSEHSIILYHDSEKEVALYTLREFERLLNDYSFRKEIIIETDPEVVKYNLDTLTSCPQLTTYELIKNIVI